MRLFRNKFAPFATNCYVREDGVIIDPGLGAARWINELATTANIKPSAIILSHGHLDHSYDAAELSDTWNIPLYVSKEDAYLLEDPMKGIRPESAEAFPDVPRLVLADVARLDYLPNSGEFMDFKLYHCPGHTHGSMLLVTDSYAFTGDVLFQGTVGRTDLPCSTPEEMVESLTKLQRGGEFALPDTLTILPGHGEGSTLRHERMNNPFLLNPGQITQTV
ncbi:MAG: MBL fold metallo-hydrolase [Corynebacterium sp.]|nr:MBL fold metallo-hydrolase [Corynebacterium sp.]